MTALILMYHRVAVVPDDFYGLAVHPERFTAHVEELAARGCATPLGDVPERPGPRGLPRIAVTFDDGYADNAEFAAPMLAVAGIPATYFITSDTLGGRPFWWDRLASALLGGHTMPDGLDVTVGGRALWLDLSSVAARRTALRFLHRRMRPLPPAELTDLLDALVAALGAAEPVPDDRAMTVEQLRTMASLPLVEIGAHTRSHLQLAGQRLELQEQEIAGSVAEVAAVVGGPVTSFAYPFGSMRAVGDVAPGLVRAAGCTMACSTESGRVTPRSNRYLLPRLNVGDWDRDEFAARLDRSLEGRS